MSKEELLSIVEKNLKAVDLNEVLDKVNEIKSNSGGNITLDKNEWLSYFEYCKISYKNNLDISFKTFIKEAKVFLNELLLKISKKLNYQIELYNFFDQDKYIKDSISTIINASEVEKKVTSYNGNDVVCGVSIKSLFDIHIPLKIDTVKGVYFIHYTTEAFCLMDSYKSHSVFCGFEQYPELIEEDLYKVIEMHSVISENNGDKFKVYKDVSEMSFNEVFGESDFPFVED